MRNHLIYFSFVFFISNCIYAHNFQQLPSLNDQAEKIYKQNPQKALEILEKALQEYKQENLNASYNLMGLVYRDIGKLEEAIKYSTLVIENSKKDSLKASAYNNLGACLRQKGAYENAIQNYLKALHIYENNNQQKEIAVVNNNIGLVYSYLGLPEKALEFHVAAQQKFEEIEYEKGVSEALNNIAIVYANKGDLDKALINFKKSLKIEEKRNDVKGKAESLNNVGGVYYYQGEVDSALVYFQKSIQLEKSIKNFAGLASSYNNMATVLMENNRLQKSKIYLDSAFNYATKYKMITDKENALFNYSQFYELSNENKNALLYFKKYADLKDSTKNIATNNKVSQLEIEYETKKKENQILQQKAKLAEKELEVRKKNMYLYGSLGLALILGLLGYLFYNQQRLKNLQFKKESQLKIALAKIQTQNELQEQRLRISRDLHDNIGAQLTFIISSLDNLKFAFPAMENKILKKLTSISDFTGKTIYELRDTIWAMNKEKISFEDLQIRITNFIEKAKSAFRGTNFEFNISSEINIEHTFTSVVGMNIYRIIQESVNNALKYAEAKKITVTIEKQKNEFLISIEDNGKGFHVENIEMGNGLQNIQKRAKQAKGEVKIMSTPERGTKITLKIAS
ncbi:tetratricopeptide repeat-containing sensor histidine kinase [Mesonia maritima]|uniref:histidine kinase n=2 Tax=Mesonia maritima TaxID=1793873 RepID=A0ABU1K8A1_9FLAO|nr:sensor histidine kinase [Mesonia maritima]MDR6301852.1 signal transduction histidine kinase [Mesonia maritima]